MTVIRLFIFHLYNYCFDCNNFTKLLFQISRYEVDFAKFNPACNSLPDEYPPRVVLTITPTTSSTQDADRSCVLKVRGLKVRGFHKEPSFPIRLFLPEKSLAIVPITYQEPQGK